MPEASVINRNDVVRGCVGEGVVGVRSPALGDVPGILRQLDRSLGWSHYMSG